MPNAKDPRLNNLVISGKLGRDPEKKHIGGSVLCNLSLAHVERYKQKDEWKEKTVWVDVKVWGKTAEYVAERMFKGSIVICSGKLSMESWEKDGRTINKLVMSAHSVDALEWTEKGTSSKNEDDDMVF